MTTDGKTDTIYYQWIPFMFVLNTVIFLTPCLIWNWSEGNFVKNFVTDESKSLFVSEAFYRTEEEGKATYFEVFEKTQVRKRRLRKDRSTID